MALTVSTDPVAEAIRVSVPKAGIRQDFRAIGIVWHRELIRLKSDRLRAITSLVQPVLFLSCSAPGYPRSRATDCRRA